MKKYLLMGGLVVLSGIIINYSLGGFEPVTPELVSTKSITLYGWAYEGSYASDSLQNQVELLRNIIAEENNKGTLTIVNFIMPELEKRGMIRQFIGIEWQDKQIKSHALDTFRIEAYNGIQFRVPVRPLVMPSPEKLKNLATEAAVDMNSELKGFSIEQYEEKTLILNFPLK